MREPKKAWIVEICYRSEVDKLYPISINCTPNGYFPSKHLCLAIFSTRAQVRRFVLERVYRFNLHLRKKGEYTGYKISKVKISEE
jgi:hypothetical protein